MRLWLFHRSQICEPMVKEQPFPRNYTLAIVHSLANVASLYQKKYRDKKMRETAELRFRQALQISEEEGKGPSRYC